MHNGIKIFDSTKTPYAHDQFNIPTTASIIVSTGRATFYKGIDLLLKAANVLINKYAYNNIYFLHIGSGPDLPTFKKMALDFGIDNKFIFAGRRNDVTRILPSCDIGIQASLGEAFSLSILEYMCAGLTTIVPNNCGNPEAIENGVNGFLFKPGDSHDIVSKIHFVLQNPDISSRIKTAARNSVIDNFALDKCNINFISTLCEIIVHP